MHIICYYCPSPKTNCPFSFLVVPDDDDDDDGGLLPTLRAMYGFRLNPTISAMDGTINCNFFNGLPINLPLDVNRPSDVHPLPL